MFIFFKVGEYRAGRKEYSSSFVLEKMCESGRQF